MLINPVLMGDFCFEGVLGIWNQTSRPGDRRVERVSLSLGNSVPSAPQTSRVEAPGGVGVEVGAWTPDVELGVVIPKDLQPLSSSGVESRDWEQLGSSGLWWDTHKIPGLKGCIPTPLSQKCRVPRAEPGKAALGQGREKFSSGLSSSPQPGLQKEFQKELQPCPVPQSRERQAGAGRGLGEPPTPRFTSPLCLRSPSPALAPGRAHTWG